MTKAFVNLWNIAGAGLIIPCETNVVFATQAGGLTCADPGNVEGVFIPLRHGQIVSDALDDYFVHGPQWQGHCYLGNLKEDDADQIDEILQKITWSKYLKVDRAKLHLSGEAWLHVTLHYPEEKDPLFSGFESKTAILTWANSD